jgi:DNA polymerase-3 subunit gamma/tau
MRQDAIDVAGDIRLDLYFRALQLIDTHSLSDAFDLDSELSFNGVDPQDYLVGLEEQIIKLLEVKAMGVEKAAISRDLKSDYTQMAERVTESDLVRVLQLCSVAETDVRRNFNPRIRLQLLVVKLATLERSVVLADLIARLEKGIPASPAATPLPAPPAVRPAPVQRPAPAIPRPAPAAVAAPVTPTKPALAPLPPSADPAEMLQRAQAAWNDLCDRIADKHNSRARLIKHGGFPVAYLAGTLRINFSSQSHLEAARALTPALKEEFTAILGPVTFDMQVGPTPQSEASAPSEPDPAAKLLMDRFGARLI